MKAQRLDPAEESHPGTPLSTDGSPSDIGKILAEIQAALEEVRSEYGELPQRETAWLKLQQLVAVQLWEAVDKPEEGRYRQQFCDQLDAAVTNLDSLQLTKQHLAVIEEALARLADRGVASADVEEFEVRWRRVGVDTLPSFGECLKQWMELSRPVADGLG